MGSGDLLRVKEDRGFDITIEFFIFCIWIEGKFMRNHIGYVVHSNKVVKDHGSRFVDHSLELSPTLEDKVIDDGLTGIVTMGCLMLDDGKQNGCHFDVQDFMTKHSMVFLESSYIQVCHPWMYEGEFTKDEILQDGFTIPCITKAQKLVSTWGRHKVCNDSYDMGLGEISSHDGIWSTLDQLCMVFDFALPRLPLSKEYHQELRNCVGYILPIEEVMGTTRRPQGEVHMNIRVVQHKHGGVTSNLDICAKDHQQDMKEASGDSILSSNVRGNTLRTATSLIFSLDVAVITIISHHITSFALIQVDLQGFPVMGRSTFQFVTTNGEFSALAWLPTASTLITLLNFA
ncbi:hypothetical protein KI387_042549 [Taxus chinensis]|uniref:Uncharacterized protein n=1 Tax=Taxus chinensis TaxID=29808 RepID=A0AA38C837_TAXCH|nr:hypothetical protein KI387_042549 [Taxus chinensis]